MFAVQDDWIQYEGVPARRAAVRGGGACAQRIPVARTPAVARPTAAGVRRTAVVVRPAGRTRSAGGRLRLTRRGRFVLIVLPALLSLSGALVVVSGAMPAQASAPLVHTVVAGSGDTLWSIARRVAPGDDPRSVVAALQRANGLQGADVPAGAVLRLPDQR